MSGLFHFQAVTYEKTSPTWTREWILHLKQYDFCQNYAVSGQIPLLILLSTNILITLEYKLK